MSRSISPSKVANAATVFCALISVVSAVAQPTPTHAAHFVSFILSSGVGSSVSGAVWNLTDSASGLSVAPDLFSQAKSSVLNSHDKMVLAWVNALHFGAVLPGFSLWGFASVMASVKAVGAKALVYTGGIALGAAPALAASSFAFAAGMFVNASISGYAWYRATQPDAPYALLEDNIHAYGKLEKKITQVDLTPEEKNELTKKQTQVKENIEVLYACALVRENSNLDDKGVKQPIIPSDKKVKIKEQVMRITQKTEEQLESQNETELKCQASKGEALIAKQIKNKRFDTIANIAGGVGALLAGLAFALPPAAIPLMIGSAVCFAVCAVMKGISWYRRYKESKQSEDNTQPKKNTGTLFSEVKSSKESEKKPSADEGIPISNE